MMTLTRGAITARVSKMGQHEKVRRSFGPAEVYCCTCLPVTIRGKGDDGRRHTPGPKQTTVFYENIELS
jgi:hypothetical protein